jgi:hypothetical protein
MTSREVSMRFDPREPLSAALARYYLANGFSPTAPERFIRIRFGAVTLPFPNTDGRRRVLRSHDLHHVATEYETDLRGEAEIAGFELGAGCGRSFEAWFYDLGAFSVGLARWPRRSLKAFLRGRHARSLLVEPTLAEVRTVGDLREALGLDSGQPTSAQDLLALVGLIALLVPYAALWPCAVAGMTVNALRARAPLTA